MFASAARTLTLDVRIQLIERFYDPLAGEIYVGVYSTLVLL
jgi:replication initiation and membrane attachment protein DnaB